MTDYDPIARKAAELGVSLDTEAARRIAAREAEQGGTREAIDRELRELSDERLEDLTDHYPAALKAWDALSLDERKAMRAREELARRRGVSQRQQAQAAETEARQRAAADAAQAEARRYLRANFAGTDAEFEDAFPGLWKRLRDRQALDGAAASHDALIARKRAELGL